MSASRAAELVVHHTQAASFHQGQERAYAEAMRLVRSLRQQAQAPGHFDWTDMFERLESLETTLYDLAQEESRKKDARNRITRQAGELLSAAAS